MRRTDQEHQPQAARPGRVLRTTQLQVEWLESRVALTTVVLGPSRDNTLYESTTGDLSDGAGQYFFAGTTNRLQLRRGVLAFDIAGSVPVGATINSVSLRLNMNMTRSATPQNVALHRLLADWGEGTSDATAMEGMGAPATPGDVTWVHRFYPSTTWTTPGGDFTATASATTSVGSVGSYTWSSATMVADVQAWRDNPAGNFGWVVRGAEGVGQTAMRFATKENPTATDRPQLTIDYTPVNLSDSTDDTGNTTLSTVSTGAGTTTYAVNAARQLFRINATGTTALSGDVQSASAGTDAAGRPMVFVLFTGGHLWRHSATAGWASVASNALRVGGSVGDSAYILFTGNHLYRYSVASGFTGLASNVSAFSPGTDAAGRAQVFVLFTGGFLWRNNTVTGWSGVASNALSVVGGAGDTAYVVFTGNTLYRYAAASGFTGLAGGVQSVAVGTDTAGREQVFVLFTGGFLWRYNVVTASWAGLASTVRRVAGASGDTAWIIFDFGGLYRHSSAGGFVGVLSGF